MRPALEMRKTLCERFPAAFFGFGMPKKPLKVGIHKDIFKCAPDLPHQAVKSALHDYCKGRTYSAQMVVGNYRIDLDGIFAGWVTETEARHSYAALHKANRLLHAESASSAAIIKRLVALLSVAESVYMPDSKLDVEWRRELRLTLATVDRVAA
jgi:sRNA-binding protein